MKKQMFSRKSGRRSRWLSLLLFLIPSLICAKNTYESTSFCAHTFTSSSNETGLSNWFQFRALTSLSTLELSSTDNPFHLFVIYSQEDGLITKGYLFEEIRTHEFATVPGRTYYIRQIDDQVNTSLLHIQVEPGEIQRLTPAEKGEPTDAQEIEHLKNLLNGPDCDQATTLCNSTDIAYNPTGSGIDDFAQGNGDGCLNGENLSAWYFFQFGPDTPPGSSIEFAIIPDGGDDYDFAVWGPDVTCGTLGAPIRCSYSSSGFTGLADGSGDFSEGPGGNGFVEDILVNPGDGFYLLIDNFSTSFSGFTLSWSGDAAPHLDCSAIPPEAECAMTAQATPNGSTAICAGQIVFVSGTANNSFGEVTYSWLATPPEAQSFIENPNSQMTIIAFPNDAEGEYTFTFAATQTSDGCVATSNIVYTVAAGEPPALDDFPDVCDTDDPVGLGQSQDGIFGNWSGENVGNNSFDPDGLSGTIALIFTPNPGQCAVADTTYINVGSSTPIDLDDIPDMCPSDESFSLPTVQSGLDGNWTGTGVEDNVFDPTDLSGAITLTFTPMLSCGSPATTDVIIEEVVEPELDDFGTPCATDDPFALPNIQDGVEGIWSIDGSEETEFNPVLYGGEDVMLIFTPLTNDEQCATEANTTITVTIAEEPFLIPLDPICQSADAIALLTFQDGYNGTWSGVGVDNNTFDPDGLSDNITLTFTPEESACATAATTDIVVTTTVVPDLEVLPAICESDAAISLNPMQDGFNGTWSGDGVFNNEFTPTNQDGSVILTFTPEESACAVANTGTITVTSPPSAELNETNLSTCNVENDANPDATIVNLQALISGGDTNGTWTDTDGSGVNMDDVTNLNFDGVTAPQTYVFTYTLTSANGVCPEQSYTVEVLVQDCSCPSVATNNAPVLCNLNGNIDLSTLENTEEEGHWVIVTSPPGDNPATLTNDIFDAAQSDAGNYVVNFVLDTAPLQGCPPSSSQTIVVENAAPPALAALDALCNQDMPIALPTVQDGVAGSWSGDGVNNNMFDPGNQSDVIDLTFTPDAGLCASPAMTTITVNTAAAPTLDSLGTTCESSNPIALPTMQDGVEGNWSGTNVAANQFNPSTLNGDITLTFEPVSGSCATTATATITVTGVFTPTLATLPNFCQSDSIFALNNMQDGVTGEWSGDGVENNQFNPTDLSGDIELTFTPTNSDCANANTTMTNVTELVTPALDALANICEEGGAIALPTIQSNVLGTWTGQGVSMTSDEFSPTDLSGEITLTFIPADDECAVQNTTTIQVDDVPFATLSTDNLMTCSTASEGSIVNLAELITDGDSNGIWEDTDGAGVNTANPSAVDFENVADGTYVFTYTTDANSTCPDASYTVEISVSTCLIDCPDVSTTPPTAPICNMDGSLDLSSLVVTEEPGTWSITDSPAGTNPAALTGTMFQASDADAGEYEVTYTIINALDLCPDTSSQLIVVEAQPFAELSTNDTTTCNAAIDGSIVDFSSFIIAGDASGTWTDDSGAGVDLADLSAVDFDGVIPDLFYSFTYTPSNLTTACPSPTYTLEVFVENCACPSVALNTTDPLCNGGESIDLTSLQLTNQVGTWSIASTPVGSNPAVLNGTIFDVNNADAGDYELQFTLAEAPEPPCPAFNTIIISVDAMLEAGVPNTPSSICNTEDTNISLANEISDEDAGGQWVETSAIPSQNNAFSVQNATFNPNGQLAGTYTFVYQVGNSTSACPTDEAIVTIEVAPTPIADAGINQQLTCNETSFTLGGSNTTGDSFEWTDDNGNVLGTSATLVVETAGTYTLTTSSDAGCMDTDAVMVSPEAAPIALAVEPIPPGCEETTGSLVVIDASGGTMPYTYGLDGQEITGASALTNLSPGTYTVQLSDNLGCQTETTVTIPEPMVITANIEEGDRQDVVWGGNTILNLSTNAGANAHIEWSNPELLSCTDSCLTTVATPAETTLISVTVTDASGCSATDDILLIVDQRPQIYPPTGFTPDDDGYNDYFMIFTGAAVQSFDSFEIFNRWGELVYGNYNDGLKLNDESVGWNGTFHGKKVDPEVFVWVAEFTLIDGTKVYRKGDVTVVR